MPYKNQNGMLFLPVQVFENDPDTAAKVLGKIGFVPFHCEFDDENEGFLMVGFSRKFKPLQQGETANQYVIEAIFDKNKVLVDVEVEELKPNGKIGYKNTLYGHENEVAH